MYFLPPLCEPAAFTLNTTSFMLSARMAGPSCAPSCLPGWLKYHLSAAGNGLRELQRHLPLVIPNRPHTSENGNTFKKPHGVRTCSTRQTKLFHSSLFWQVFNSPVYPCLLFTHKTWNNSIYQVYLDEALSWPLKQDRDKREKQQNSILLTIFSL